MYIMLIRANFFEFQQEDIFVNGFYIFLSSIDILFCNLLIVINLYVDIFIKTI